MKKIVYIILLVLWMGVIFLFSNQNGVKSQGLSDKFINDIISINNKSMSKSNRLEIISNVSYLVRKVAHFTEYLILGILFFLVYREFGIKKLFLIVIVSCFLYACSDEIHQLFLSGRSAKIIDVFIDTCGSMAGAFVISRHKNCKID